MLRRNKGQSWGASSKLIMNTYKALIRPIIDYVPFATVIMSETKNSNLSAFSEQLSESLSFGHHEPVPQPFTSR